MRRKCDVDGSLYDRSDTCAADATHFVVAEDGTVLGCVCRKHATVDCGCEQWQMDGFIHKCSQQSMNTGTGWDVKLVSLFCESCRQRLPADRYPGPKCPECMRAVMVASATKEQTAAIVALHQTMARLEEKAIAMSREHTDMGTTNTQKTGMIDRATAFAGAMGADKMALRAAARQIIKAVKQPLAAGLATRLKGGKPREFTRSIAAFLDTPLGNSGLSLFLGGLVKVFPGVPDAYRDSLSQEFIVEGGAVAMDFAADIFMGPIRDALSGGVALLANPSAASSLRDGGIKVENVSDEKVAV